MVCEGCWFEPSPALITGTGEISAANLAAPSLLCRITRASVYEVMILIESIKVSPFLPKDVLVASEKPITLPPKRWIAVSKDSLVRVEPSKKVTPINLSFNKSLRGCAFNSNAVFRISSMWSFENSEIEMISFWKSGLVIFCPLHWVKSSKNGDAFAFRSGCVFSLFLKATLYTN